MAESEILDAVIERMLDCRIQECNQRVGQLQTELGEIRQVRQRRARLLLKARNLKLTHCTKRLREPGMTIQNNGSRPWLTYDPRACGFHRERIANDIKAQKLLRRRIVLDGPTTLRANLIALEDDTTIITVNSNKLQWVMDDVWLEDVQIGSLRVSVSLERFDVDVENLTADLAKKAVFLIRTSGETGSSVGMDTTKKPTPGTGQGSSWHWVISSKTCCALAMPNLHILLWRIGSVPDLSARRVANDAMRMNWFGAKRMKANYVSAAVHTVSGVTIMFM